MTDTWIPGRLAEVGRSQADLARALDIDRSIVTRLVKGERRIQLDEIPIIANVLELSVTEVLRRLGIDLDEEFVEAGGLRLEERSLLDLWRRLSAEERRIALAMIEGAAYRGRAGAASL